MLSRLADLGTADRVALETRFETALGALWMAYQPIVDASGQSVRAYEALLRSDEPTLSQALPLLEASLQLGRRQELGRRIRKSVARTIASLPAHALIFVNVDAADLHDSELYGEGNPLFAYAPRIVLEITERTSLHGTRTLERKLARLRGQGFTLALDDVQQPRALYSVSWIQPEYVKLDLSLVRNIHRDGPNQQRVQALTQTIQELGRRVVAEGVEQTAEHEVLSALGCDLLQGHLFGRPQPSPFRTAA